MIKIFVVCCIELFQPTQGHLIDNFFNELYYKSFLIFISLNMVLLLIVVEDLFRDGFQVIQWGF